jgi:hypothetical protein
MAETVLANAEVPVAILVYHFNGTHHRGRGWDGKARSFSSGARGSARNIFVHGAFHVNNPNNLHRKT